MSFEIELLSARQSRRIPVRGERTTIGKAAENDISLPDDPAVSRLHAVLEQFPAGWCLTDVGSSNGTWLNGERVFTARRLRHGDEIQIGHTRLLVRDPTAAAHELTDSVAAPPTITARARDVLVSLCRPLLARDTSTEPASTGAIANELVITQAAVKQHLSNLYDKFAIPVDDSNRRVRLANEALRSGSVAIGDLRAG
jgi:pSer/pThr/pTyr-binding forkhead associated (FHA) protein